MPAGPVLYEPHTPELPVHSDSAPFFPAMMWLSLSMEIMYVGLLLLSCALLSVQLCISAWFPSTQRCGQLLNAFAAVFTVLGGTAQEKTLRLHHRLSVAFPFYIVSMNYCKTIIVVVAANWVLLWQSQPNRALDIKPPKLLTLHSLFSLFNIARTSATKQLRPTVLDAIFLQIIRVIILIFT